MPITADGPTLHPITEELAAGPNYAAVTVVLPGGQLQTQVLWVGLIDGQVVINTEVHRARYKALQADPRITVMIWDAGDPLRYAEVRGRVTAESTGADARRQIDELCQKYSGHDYPDEGVTSERITLHVTAERQVIIDRAP